MADIGYFVQCPPLMCKIPMSYMVMADGDITITAVQIALVVHVV